MWQSLPIFPQGWDNGRAKPPFFEKRALLCIGHGEAPGVRTAGRVTKVEVDKPTNGGTERTSHECRFPYKHPRGGGGGGGGGGLIDG